MTLKNNRAPLLSNIKLYAPFHHQMWIRTGVTIRKRLSWVMTSVTLTFDLWPWPFAWTSLLSWVITPENFVMIRWWEHSQKGVTDRRTDRQTDRRTDWTIHRAAWSQLNKANLRDLIAATGLVISNWIQIVNFSARVTVKFDRWPCNTIGHLFYATSSFVHHFVAIGEFKLQLQSGNAQSGSNSTIFRGVRPWNLMDDLAKQ